MLKKQNVIGVALSFSLSIVLLSGCVGSNGDTKEDSAKTKNSSTSTSGNSSNTNTPDDGLPKNDAYQIRKDLESYKDVMTLTGYYNIGYSPAPNNYFHDWILEHFKIDLKFNYVSGENFNDKVRTLASAGQLPDLIESSDSQIFSELAKSGQLLPWDDLLDKYVPTANKWYAKELRDMVRQPDGKLYTIVGYNLPIGDKETQDKYFGGAGFGQVFAYNRDILSKTGMSVPRTLDDTYNYLKKAVALKEVNGKKITGAEINAFGSQTYTNVTYPGLGTGPRGILLHLFQQFPTSWTAQPEDSTQMMKFAYDFPGYVNYLKYFAKLYRENLMDKDSFTMNTDQINEKLKGGGVALTAFLDNIEADNLAASGDTTKPYSPMDYPKDPSVTHTNVLTVNPMGNWFFAANKNVKDPVRLAKFLEWHLTDDGLMFDNYGPPDSSKKRNDWWYDDSGKPVLDLELQQKWDKEKPNWESNEAGTWGAYAFGLRMSLNYYRPVEFGVNMATDYMKALDSVVDKDSNYYYVNEKLDLIKFMNAPFGPIFTMKGTKLNDLLNKWEVRIIISAKSDSDVDSMFQQMMKEARSAGYDDIAKEAYQIYQKVNKK